MENDRNLNQLMTAILQAQFTGDFRVKLLCLLVDRRTVYFLNGIAADEISVEIFRDLLFNVGGLMLEDFRLLNKRWDIKGLYLKSVKGEFSC